MRNILNQGSADKQHGRTGFILTYVKESDIRGKSILNIGSGFGWFEYNMMRFNPKHCVGIDVTQEDIEKAKMQMAEYEKVEFLVADALALPFSDNVFDTVVTWDVLEHIPKDTEKQFFMEISRVLKPGGTYYLSTPFANIRAMIMDPAWLLIGHRHYSRGKMRKLIEETRKLSVDEMFVRGGWISSLYIINLYVCKWLFRRPPICATWFDEKTDIDYQKEKGTETLFVKGTRVGTDTN